LKRGEKKNRKTQKWGGGKNYKIFSHVRKQGGEGLSLLSGTLANFPISLSTNYNQRENPFFQLVLLERAFRPFLQVGRLPSRRVVRNAIFDVFQDRGEGSGRPSRTRSSDLLQTASSPVGRRVSRWCDRGGPASERKGGTCTGEFTVGLGTESARKAVSHSFLIRKGWTQVGRFSMRNGCPSTCSCP